MNDRIDSVIMALAQMYVACTLSGAIVFGRMWRMMIIGVRVPEATDAST